ncbi:MAG: hypothetical protein IH622_22835 [Ochrobactrum anthropi]|uniref:Uncharacterized protein n=1 Tax=Brucella anthropi TaxID=529 RepID=A0A8I0NAN5_BRUAN|nr:hypothetical protein [Brucella anthropi]MBE0563632.1 hypothetical protein [Brucella anthropi]MCR5943492.1 hypothetical protein [Ochrobactrum sp. XJ1]
MAYKRKADDNQIIELNSIGLSLSGIGDRLDIHPTTVAQRLKVLGIDPADTRRAFMEDIFEKLTLQQQDWLTSQLSAGRSVKDFVRLLIVNEFVSQKRTGLSG